MWGSNSGFPPAPINSNAFRDPPPKPYSCNLHPNQRSSGSLCKQKACVGCLPFRKQETVIVSPGPAQSFTRAAPDWVELPMPLPTAVSQPAPVESVYISRLEHETALQRAVWAARQESQLERFAAAAFVAGKTPEQAVQVAKQLIELLEAEKSK